MKRASLAIVLCLFAAPAFSADKLPITIAVPMPEAPAFVDDTSQRLMDSTKDLRAALAKMKSVTLAETAPITIVVTSSKPEPTGRNITQKNTGLFDPAGVNTTAEQWRTVRAKLTIGDYSVEFKGQAMMAWKDATRNLVGEIRKWIEKNRARLEAAQ